MQFSVRGVERDLTHYDFQLIGEDSRLILSATDFAMMRIEGGPT